MKKRIEVLVAILMTLTVSSFALAQGNQQGQGEPQKINADNKGVESAAQNLKRVVDRNNNPGVGEQIRAMVESHEEIQTRTKTALSQMNQRSNMVKFFIGPDYKNAGQVRSDVVGLRNDIKKLEQIKEGYSPEDAGDIQGAIDELQVEANELENQLTEELSGFSLFGWLSKLLAN